MTKYKGKYKSSSGLMQQNRKRMLHASMLWIGLTIGVGGLVYGCVRLRDTVSISKASARVDMVETEEVEQQVRLAKKRLNRDQIPELNFGRCSYGRTFDDMNEEQLVAAKANGIHDPNGVEEMIANGELYQIKSNDLYVIDTLTHSKPYLVENAALMLDYVGMRFQEVLKESGHTRYGYRPIVTSVLRCPKDVARLRRVNCNASENSCHIYGTTIDITYIRFLRDDGEEVNELWLKEALAKTMYELRYEGICYVRYEYRQGCFHITVRDTEYRGEMASTMCYYDAKNDIQPSLLAYIKGENRGDELAEVSIEEDGMKEAPESKRELRKMKREQDKAMKRAMVEHRKMEREKHKELEKIKAESGAKEGQYTKNVKYTSSSGRDNYVTYASQPNVKDIKQKRGEGTRERDNGSYVSEYVVF